MSSPRRIAVLGAGPIGLEAALRALEEGFEVDVYERDEPASAVARWGHVRLFSPWKMNRSFWAASRLRRAGVELASGEAHPTGREFRRDYLLRLARLDEIAERLHTDTQVIGVSRRHAFKSQLIGDEARAEEPFVILVDGPDGRRYEEADIVFDTTGVYDRPRRLGPGGLEAIGEADAENLIERYVPDPFGGDRAQYEGKTTLLIGGGYSAVTSARLLHDLIGEAPDTRLCWLLPGEQPPYPPILDDPLAERAALSGFGNEAARNEVDGIEPIVGRLRRLERVDDGLVAGIEAPGGTRELAIDRVVGNVGYRPDTSLFDELQVHLCYATEGLMDLSAHLLAQGGDAAGDCLQQTSGGFDTLTSPEPDFFVLGSKSYGRNSDFLLQMGFEQIDHVFARLEP